MQREQKQQQQSERQSLGVAETVRRFRRKKFSPGEVDAAVERYVRRAEDADPEKPLRHNLGRLEGPAVSVRRHTHNNGGFMHDVGDGPNVDHPVPDAQMLHHAAAVAGHAWASSASQARPAHGVPENFVAGAYDPERHAATTHGVMMAADPEGRVVANRASYPIGQYGESGIVRSLWGLHSPSLAHLLRPDYDVGPERVRRARQHVSDTIRRAESDDRLHATVRFHGPRELHEVLKEAINNPSQGSTGMLYDLLAGELNRPDLANRLYAVRPGDGREHRYHEGPDVAGALAEPHAEPAPDFGPHTWVDDDQVDQSRPFARADSPDRHQGERKGPTSFENPGAFAPAGQGSLLAQVLNPAPTDGVGRPQPAQLQNAPSRVPGRPNRPAGKGATQLDFSQAARPGDLLAHLAGHPRGEADALLLQLAHPDARWHAAEEAERDHARDSLSSVPTPKLWRLLAQINVRGGHPDAGAMVRKELSARDGWVEHPLTEGNREQAFRHRDDPSLSDAEEKDVNALLASLPRVRGVPGAFFLPRGLKLEDALGKKYAGLHSPLSDDDVDAAQNAAPSYWFDRPLPTPEEARSDRTAWRPLGAESVNTQHGGGLWSVRTADGRRYVAKLHADPGEADVEQAASGALRMMGFRDVPKMEVRPSKYGRTLFMARAPGKELMEATDQDLEKLKRANPPERVAELLAGLWAINADDRHWGNYLYDDSGRVYPIDLGFSLHPRTWSRHAWGQHRDALLDAGLASRDQEIPADFVRKLAGMGGAVIEHVTAALPAGEKRYRESVRNALSERFDFLRSAAVRGQPVRLRDLPKIGSRKKRYRKDGPRRYNFGKPLPHGPLVRLAEGHTSLDRIHVAGPDDAAQNDPHTVHHLAMLAGANAVLGGKAHQEVHNPAWRHLPQVPFGAVTAFGVHADPDGRFALHHLGADARSGPEDLRRSLFPGGTDHAEYNFPLLHPHPGAWHSARGRVEVHDHPELRAFMGAVREAGHRDRNAGPFNMFSDFLAEHGHPASEGVARAADWPEVVQALAADHREPTGETDARAFIHAGVPPWPELKRMMDGGYTPTVYPQTPSHQHVITRLVDLGYPVYVGHGHTVQPLLRKQRYARPGTPERHELGDSPGADRQHGLFRVPVGDIGGPHAHDVLAEVEPPDHGGVESLRRGNRSRPLIANEGPGGGLELLDGRHRLHAMKKLGHPEAHVIVVSPEDMRQEVDEVGRPFAEEGWVEWVHRKYDPVHSKLARREYRDDDGQWRPYPQYAEPDRHAKDEHPAARAVREAAESVHPEPSPRQREAGNHAMGHFRWNGLGVTLEVARGQTRTKTGKDGRPWSRLMHAHYGYVKGTEGRDGGQVDVYVGDRPESDLAVVIPQLREDGSLDEYKAVVGCVSADEALALYLRHYPDGWRKSRVGTPRAMTAEQFREWATSPAARRVSRSARDGNPERYTLNPHEPLATYRGAGHAAHAPPPEGHAGPAHALTPERQRHAAIKAGLVGLLGGSYHADEHSTAAEGEPHPRALRQQMRLGADPSGRVVAALGWRSGGGGPPPGYVPARAVPGHGPNAFQQWIDRHRAAGGLHGQVSLNPHPELRPFLDAVAAAGTREKNPAPFQMVEDWLKEQGHPVGDMVAGANHWHDVADAIARHASGALPAPARHGRDETPERYGPLSPHAVAANRALHATLTAHRTGDPGHMRMASDLIEQAGHPQAADLQARLGRLAEAHDASGPHGAGHYSADPQLTGVLHDVLHHAEQANGRPGFAAHVRPAAELHRAAVDALEGRRHREAAAHIRALSRAAGDMDLVGGPEPAFFHRQLAALANALEDGAISPESVLQGPYGRGISGQPWWHGHRMFHTLGEDTHGSGRNVLDAQRLLRETGPHDFARDDSPERFGVAHAPEGGTDADGRHYDGGQFVPGGGHAGGAAPAAPPSFRGRQNLTAPERSRRENVARAREVLEDAGRKGLDAASAAWGTAAHCEHAASAWAADRVSDAVDRLPLPVQGLVVGVWAALRLGSSALFATYTAGQALAEEVALARGATPEQAKRLRGILSAVDVTAAKPVVVAAEAASLGTVGWALGLVPVASTAYLAYSAARDPVATMHGAREAVRKALSGDATTPPARHAREDARLAADALLAALDVAPDPDRLAALVCAALDEGLDLRAAVEIAGGIDGPASSRHFIADGVSVKYGLGGDPEPLPSAEEIGNRGRMKPLGVRGGLNDSMFITMPDGRKVFAKHASFRGKPEPADHDTEMAANRILRHAGVGGVSPVGEMMHRGKRWLLQHVMPGEDEYAVAQRIHRFSDAAPKGVAEAKMNDPETRQELMRLVRSVPPERLGEVGLADWLVGGDRHSGNYLYGEGLLNPVDYGHAVFPRPTTDHHFEKSVVSPDYAPFRVGRFTPQEFASMPVPRESIRKAVEAEPAVMAEVEKLLPHYPEGGQFGRDAVMGHWAGKMAWLKHLLGRGGDVRLIDLLRQGGWHQPPFRPKGGNKT